MQVRRADAGVVQKSTLWRLPGAVFHFHTHLHGVKSIYRDVDIKCKFKVYKPKSAQESEYLFANLFIKPSAERHSNFVFPPFNFRFWWLASAELPRMPSARRFLEHLAQKLE